MVAVMTVGGGGTLYLVLLSRLLSRVCDTAPISDKPVFT